MSERRSRAAGRLVGAGAAAALLISANLLHPPAATANSFPGWANSHYVSYSASLTQSFFEQRGCDTANGEFQGGGVDNLATVLDFGGVAKVDTTYGANLWYAGGSTFKGVNWIQHRIESFATGLWNCSSTIPLFTILAGVHSDSGQVTGAHGTAWANMVDAANATILANGYDAQVWVMGAIDIEAGFFAPYSKLKNWVDSYSTAADTSAVYNFGSLNGCPTNASYTSPPGYRCTGSSGCSATTSGCFYQNNYWYLSSGCGACAMLGEIYNTFVVTLPNGKPSDPNAQQWEGLRRYAYHEKGGADFFMSGSTTQWTACKTRSCNGTDNTQLEGWTHLHNSQDAYLPQWDILPWSTDFMWGW